MGEPGVHVRAAHPEELDAAGAAVRAAYEADGLVGDDYLAVVGDAHERARDAEVAVALLPPDPASGGSPDPAADTLPGASRPAVPVRPAPADVVGSVTFTLPGSRWSELARPGQAEFRMLGVVPAARGRGVGLALVDWCLARARAAGAREVVICSATTMAAAHRLYALRGFTRRAELDWSPVPGVDLLGFALSLER